MPKNAMHWKLGDLKETGSNAKLTAES